VLRRVPYLALSLMFMAVAAEAGPVDSELSAARVFDIPPLPLAAALERYGDATGREVLYNPALTNGRDSASVKGIFLPETALHILLAGTGLSARFMKDNSFVLVPTPEPAGHPDGGAIAQTRHYYGLVQARLRDALCRAGDVRPGRFRIAALVWVEPAGTVAKFERLGSAVDDELDRGIENALRNLSVGAPVPAGFAQPILIVILPRAPGVTMSCAATGLPPTTRGAP
jgi:hypothetical protein